MNLPSGFSGKECDMWELEQVRKKKEQDIFPVLIAMDIHVIVGIFFNNSCEASL